MYENTTSPCSKVQAKIRHRDHFGVNAVNPAQASKRSRPGRRALAVHHLFAVLFYVARGIARIDHQLGVAHDGLVVVAGMIGGN